MSKYFRAETATVLSSYVNEANAKRYEQYTCLIMNLIFYNYGLFEQIYLHPTFRLYVNGTCVPF